ncbi:MAG: hypothetical protein JHC95_13410 [Solirubrobacteraceae bacterium]|nr:hypothetical protein [Solirubrobacteraceae bacterium]
MSELVNIGLFELAFGAILGWLITLRLESPDTLRRIGVRNPRRLLQMHIDFVMMGIILIAVGLAVPDLATWIAVPLVFGTIVNPLGFLPLAFDEEQRRKAYYRVIITVSFIGTSGGLTAAAFAAL